MSRKLTLVAILVTMLGLLMACSRTAQPTADAQATIDAAVQATQSAGQNTQATIDASVQATVQAQASQQAAVDQAVQATLTAMPTPAYAEMSEEELAALIDEAVTAALEDYAATSTTVTQSTSDGTVTSEEATSTTTYVYEVYNEIAYAEELIAAYYEYYGAYAEEALVTLQAMEEDLSAISDSLNEIEAIMVQGAEAATAAIEQLNAAAAEAQATVAGIQAQAQTWQQQVQAAIGQREDKITSLPPTEISADSIGAINQAHDFLEAFKTALDDGKFSPEELNKVGQLAANAQASLKGTGDPQFQALAERIDGLTRNAARGEWNHARSGVGDFEKSMPPRRRR